MTFEEAFNSGLRFKLPKNYNGYKNSWPDDWWLIKESDSKVRVINNNSVHSIDWLFTDKDDEVEFVSMEKRVNYLGSNDWYIHPQDVFDKKYIEIINE